jgi:hypothetical protein
VDRRSTVEQMDNIRGVIYQKLNSGCHIANRWIHQGVKCNFPIKKKRKEKEGKELEKKGI